MTDPKRYDEFAALLEQSSSRVLSYLHTLLLNWADTEDVFQDTCLVLWQKYSEFEPGTNFVAWALRIAQNKAMNFRQKQTRYATFTAGLRDTLLTEFADRTAETANSNLSALSECMDQLPPNDQRMMKLSYVEDIPVRQLADALGRSPESVHNSLLRIRNTLLDCLHRKLNQADVHPSLSRQGGKGEGP